MNETRTTAIWFRHDLRVADNPALHSACERGAKVVGVFVSTPGQWQRHHVSARRLSLLSSAVEGLRQRLAQLGVDLHCLETEDFAGVPALLDAFLRDTQPLSLHVNREYALDERRRDAEVATLCRQRGVEWIAHHGSVLLTPGSVRTQQGEPYRVFTPFKRRALALLANRASAPLPVPAACGDVIEPAKTRRNAPPKPTADVSAWPGDEDAANARLDHFLAERVQHYHSERDIPSVDGTSRLSPCLTLGTLSPRQCLHRCLLSCGAELSAPGEGPGTWINELLWRDFYLHQLHAFPRISYDLPLRKETEHVPWRHDRSEFSQWCDGETGYPLVDAAMRQLRQSGWMHNRLRMLTAMFLSKALLIDWRWGERYFMEQLVDAHFASNNGGWQWSASTGVDAAPYFRLLSPVRQAQRFDPEAVFIKSYLPNLKSLPPSIIHQPGHPDLLGKGYPRPMVDWPIARERCLAAFARR